VNFKDFQPIVKRPPYSPPARWGKASLR